MKQYFEKQKKKPNPQPDLQAYTLPAVYHGKHHHRDAISKIYTQETLGQTYFKERKKKGNVKKQNFKDLDVVCNV
jgi:hypothetical protein